MPRLSSLMCRRMMAALTCVLLSLGLPASAQVDRAALLDIRLGDHPDKTRFVVELSEQVDFSLFLLDAPYRLVLDFPNLDWQSAQTDAAGVGLIERYYRAGFDRGPTRLVLDLGGPVRVRDVFFIDRTDTVPVRFVLDVEPADDAAFAEALATPMGQHTLLGPLPTPDASVIPATLLPPVRPEVPARPVVVIDPGHGGQDPGAVSPTGLFEKTITLSVSLQLRDALAESGRYDVVMTRDHDEYLPLRERVRRARDAGADLFISIHADANPMEWVRGASVYTLSDMASDREAAMLAARENRVDALVGVDMDPEDDVMATILIDLAQRMTHTESNAIARFVVQQLGGITLLLQNTHREAGFAVLTAPDVPSVLIELGHLSNSEDEELLMDPDHQADLVEAMRTAVDDYFDWLEAVNGS